MSNSILDRFGQRLKKIRNERNITQEQLAEMAGLDRTYVSSVERGQRNISLKAIESLAIALDISIDTFFREI